VRVRSGSIKARGWNALMHDPSKSHPNGRPVSAFFSAVVRAWPDSQGIPGQGLKFTEQSFTIND